MTPHPSLFSPPPPPAPITLAGWSRGDMAEVLTPVGWTRARVVSAMRARHSLLLRTLHPDRLIEVNPITHPHTLRKP